MRYLALARIAATLLALTIAGAALGSRDSDGYPPPPGPYRSGPWTGEVAATSAMEPAASQTPTRTGRMLLPPTPLTDDPADYSATTLFGAAPEPALPETTPLPAWPGTPPAAGAVQRPQPAYAPVERRADFSIGASGARPPSDFSIGSGRPQQRVPASGQLPRFDTPMAPADSRDFASLPSTLPGDMPMPEPVSPLAPPADSWSAVDAPLPERAPAATARTFSPAPAPAVTMPAPPRAIPAGPAADTGTPVFRPPGLIAD